MKKAKANGSKKGLVVNDASGWSETDPATLQTLTLDPGEPTQQIWDEDSSPYSFSTWAGERTVTATRPEGWADRESNVCVIPASPVLQRI